MTPTLVPHHPARDWAEIQERMLVPLYEAVYERLGVGAGSRVLGLGCGSGLALLMAVARGARVSGADRDHARVELAGRRLPEGVTVTGEAPEAGPYDVITAFHATDGLLPELTALLRTARRGTAVALAGWGPPERCATEPVLRIAARLTPRKPPVRTGPAPFPDRAPTVRTEPARLSDRAPTVRADLDRLVAAAGLRPVASGWVACPFGYADEAGAVRGLLSTGVFDEALRATDPSRVGKEIAAALAPYARADGTVWMPNTFRYVLTRVP
ncbi:MULTISPECIES: class I SAM-dependent methyltransferase [unclassified Streptomyces]|uniref:class I SAM-dependent methyltransferase n=1 Tax=unclassified Streptomyces TaxID=2593676 RepID=UPI0016606D33|nr:MULTISPECIES: methyltransferase domain-containing protein [unclassified Streptomyces]MBD0711308.1 methyltransferase type 11 [Streptomyces sp. CBMA291]MBD0714863.1 methyltransferase type 11 [Streptomyces sp. CBMA370]